MFVLYEHPPRMSAPNVRTLGLVQMFVMCEQVTMDIVTYRKSLGLTQEAFGALFGLKSKGQVSEIEKSNRCSAEVALAIERHSLRKVDAGTLNDVVATARCQPPAPAEQAAA